MDATFVFLLLATLVLGVRSLLDTYTVREIAKRLGSLLALSFVLLVSFDFTAEFFRLFTSIKTYNRQMQMG